MYDKELDRIYGYSSDPNNGKWFISDNHNYVRYFDDIREIIHKNNNNKWTVSIGGPDKLFQVGEVEFDNTNQAKKWADSRDMDSLHYLELTINKWRSL